MTVEIQNNSLDSSEIELRKSLRHTTLEGTYAVVHITLTGGAFLTGFALLLGANDFILGLLAAIPFIAQIAQLAAAYEIDRTGKRKFVTTFSALVMRQSWWLLLPLPFMRGDWRLGALIGVFIISSIAGMMASAGWTSWVADLVPQRIRGRYFGIRNAATGLVTIVTTLAGGAALDFFRVAGIEGVGFDVIFAIACIFALAAIYEMSKMPEVKIEHRGQGISWNQILDPLRDKRFRHLILIFLAWNFSLGISACFFAVQMLTTLKMSFMLIALYSSLASITAILLNKRWGIIIDKFGCKPVITFCTFALSIVPLIWLIPRAGHLEILIFEAIYSGGLWAGFNLAAFNIPIANSPQKNRTTYLAMFAVVPALGFFASSLLGGALAELWKDVSWKIGYQTIINYHILFAMSGVMRLAAAFLTLGFKEPGERDIPSIINDLGIWTLRRPFGEK
jgi:MFS family permease